MNLHYPIEIFGFPISNKADIKNCIKNNYLCPFLNSKCDKQSRLIPYPMGVCSVIHMGEKIPICPNRFLDSKKVFIDVSKNYFGDTDNILIFSEVGLNGVGNFDFVLVKHEPLSNKIIDFCMVEFQSDSTTQTGKLVQAFKDFMDGKDITKNRYNYGMNTYNTIKLSYIQMLNKGQVIEKWGKKIYWIEPKFIFENMIKRFDLSNMNYDSNESNVYFIYDLELDGNKYKLNKVYEKSCTIANLLTAFTKQSVPKIDDFVHILQSKIQLKLGISFEKIF